MITHWLKTGWRSLIANPLFSLITIASLSIGCCGALLAGANIKQHLSFDRWVPAAERTLLLRERTTTAGVPNARVSDVWTPAVHDAVATMPGFEDQTIVTDGVERTLRDENGAERGHAARYSVMSNYFDFFGIPFVEGASDTAFRGKESMVIAESVARQLFGAPPWIGKAFTYDDGPEQLRATVTGVVRDMPFASHRRGGFFELFDFDTNPYIRKLRADWGTTLYGGHYVRVKRGVDVAGFQSLLKTQIEQASEQVGSTGTSRLLVSSVALPEIHMAGGAETDLPSTGDWTILLTLGSGALALLVVSAFNFVTLSLARSLRRRREVSVRKVLGAGQGSIVRHYLAESMMVTLVSLVIGFGLADLLHPWFARQLNQPEELVNLYDPVFLGGAAIGGVLLALLVGAYPAFYLAHVRPRSGLDQNEAAGAGPIARAVSNGLLVLQIGGATALLALALTMAAQARYIASRPLGYSVANMHYIALGCPDTPGAMFAPAGCDRVSLAPVRTTPGVLAATRAAVLALFSDRVNPRSVTRPGQAAELGKARFVASEPDFLQLMEAKLLAGRLFDDASSYDRQLLDKHVTLTAANSGRLPVVVTRAFLPLIGAATPEDAIGQLFADPKGAPGVGAFEVVGVVEDWRRRSLRYGVEPIAFTPGGTPMQIVAKYAPGAEASINAALQGADGAPGVPVSIPIKRFDDSFAASYNDDRRVMTAVSSFAGLAIVVAGLGVFALSAFEVRRRVREIGIRKALGAAPAAVASVVMTRNIRLAAVSAILSWPFGWWLAISWLNGFVYRTDLGLAILPAAAAAVVVFVGLAVAFNALRAAAIRPDVALRTAT
jgi:putative ABC transport system permease protein